MKQARFYSMGCGSVQGTSCMLACDLQPLQLYYFCLCSTSVCLKSRNYTSALSWKCAELFSYSSIGVLLTALVALGFAFTALCNTRKCESPRWRSFSLVCWAIPVSRLHGWVSLKVTDCHPLSITYYADAPNDLFIWANDTWVYRISKSKCYGSPNHPPRSFG